MVVLSLVLAVANLPTLSLATATSSQSFAEQGNLYVSSGIVGLAPTIAIVAFPFVLQAIIPFLI
ncbi:hypothetical protein BDR26DRAFT_865235 [Obelidium mucronatum]|nr:hypothetical protein BDR26DRAFT_865235 [Obelidium mucronatum]